jgi:aminomethyltransferase
MAEDNAPLHEIWPKDHFRRPLIESPFHERVAGQMRANVWTSQAGYLAAGVIEDAGVEHAAIRNASALYDISPLMKYRISGPDAVAYLDRITLRAVSGLATAKVMYTAWCDEDGRLVDDGTLFRLSETEFRLCCRGRHMALLLDSSPGFDVTIEDVTRRIAGLAIQGPTSFAVLKRAGFADLASLEPGSAKTMTLPGTGIDALVSRTGITGDLGYELFVPADQATTLWDALWRAGRLHGLRAAGMEAVDMARIEAGNIVPGRDFVPSGQAVTDGGGRSPLELGLGWMVDFGKGHFNGRRALAAQRDARGAARRLVGLAIDGPHAAPGAIVHHRGKRRVGEVTSAVWSPATQSSIALASLDSRYAAQGIGNLTVEIQSVRELRPHKAAFAARIVARPFVALSRSRATPPAGF